MHKPFKEAVGGNVSAFFALAVIPVMLAVGGATDFVRQMNAQTALSAAIDGAALAAAQNATATEAQRTQIARDYFMANFKSNVTGTSIQPTDIHVTVSGGGIRLTANVDMPTSLLHLVGIDTLAVNSVAEANLPSAGNAEVVLVLDYSGSMNANRKYSRMADAAKNMVTALEAAADDVDFKIGLVPFSAMVRTSMSSAYVNQVSAETTWTGCTQDRSYPYNTGVSTPTSDAATKWGYIDNNGENNGQNGCAAYANKKLEIRPLTTDFNAVRTQLDAMRPLGNTNISLGAEFGWNLLDPALPYAEARPYSDLTNKKFLVLLTDGVQTSREWGESNSRSVPNAQQNLLALCQGMRNVEITVFTIAYDVTDPAVTTLLESCAPGRYYEPAVNSTDLNAVFSEITTQITDDVVRLTR